MTTDRNSDKTYIILLFLLLQSRDWVDWGKHHTFAKVTTFYWLFVRHMEVKLLLLKCSSNFEISHTDIKDIIRTHYNCYFVIPSKIKSLRTFNARSRHAFPIAILVLLLPKSSITKQAYSNSTFKVFHVIPHLATARIQNFFTLHVAI